MASLNLLSRDPVPEPDDEINLPETPPGLDAIRAWLRKPRPWLRGVRLWIEWILSGPPEAWRWLRERGPRIAKSLRRVAAEGTVTRRVLERVGHLLRETAMRIDAAARAFRDPRGESGPAASELDQLPETFRRLGERVTFGARIVGIVVSALNRLADLFPESPAATPLPAPEPDPAPRPVPGPSSSPSSGPPKEPPFRPPPPDSPETHVPAPAAIPRQVDWEARLKGLPPILHKWVRDLGERPRRESLHALILKICSLREWTSSEELARYLDMHQPSLVQRHLSGMVEAGLLELQFPDRPSTPRQAYRTRPEAGRAPTPKT